MKFVYYDLGLYRGVELGMKTIFKRKYKKVNYR